MVIFYQFRYISLLPDRCHGGRRFPFYTIWGGMWKSMIAAAMPKNNGIIPPERVQKEHMGLWGVKGGMGLDRVNRY